MIRKYTKETEIGKQYGNLKVVDFTAAYTVSKNKIRARVTVICLQCNSEPYSIKHNSVVRLNREVTSCANCARKEVHLLNTKHGLSDHPYYTSCKGAIDRCRVSNKDHKNYFDRGITCYWTLDTITSFIEYLENNLPPRQINRSLDRINNNRGYEPGNLRWATNREQVLNRRVASKLDAENRELKNTIRFLNSYIEILHISLGVNQLPLLCA